jgi:hypothetical protein
VSHGQFIQLGYSSAQLGVLNQCHVYLQAIFLSNLMSADGTVIIHSIKQGHQITDRISTLNWPILERPSPSAWSLWKQALAHFENRDRLLIPLRQWRAETHQRWWWFSEPSS